MHKTCLPLHSGTADDKIINDVELKNVPFSYMEILVAVQEECYVPCAVCNDLAALSYYAGCMVDPNTGNASKYLGLGPRIL